MMSEVELDRERVIHGETPFELNPIMGGVGLIVPPGLRVEADGVALLGDFDGKPRRTLRRLAHPRFGSHVDAGLPTRYL
jgi:hypothetical protein